MWVSITRSAMRHGIAEEEIRCAVKYPLLTFGIVSRRYPDASPRLFVGQYAENEPLLEVVGETHGEEIEVFHALLLRWSTVHEAGIASLIDTTNIARAQRK